MKEDQDLLILHFLATHLLVLLLLVTQAEKVKRCHPLPLHHCNEVKHFTM